MTLHGVGVETAGDEAIYEMAACFIEEYVRLGFDADRILRLFHTRGYAGPALALHRLGEERIRELIVEAFALRGARDRRRSAAVASADVSLSVLDPAD